MFTIKFTDEFLHWFGGLKDRMNRQRLNVRLRKAMLSNLGDVCQSHPTCQHTGGMNHDQKDPYLRAARL